MVGVRRPAGRRARQRRGYAPRRAASCGTRFISARLPPLRLLLSPFSCQLPVRPCMVRNRPVGGSQPWPDRDRSCSTQTSRPAGRSLVVTALPRHYGVAVARARGRVAHPARPGRDVADIHARAHRDARHVRQPRATARASPAGGLAGHTRRRRAAHTPAQRQARGAEGGRVVRPSGARQCRHRRARRRCRMLSALSRHPAGDELRHRSGRVLPAGAAAVRTFAVIGHGRRHARRDGILLGHAPTRRSARGRER